LRKQVDFSNGVVFLQGYPGGFAIGRHGNVFGFYILRKAGVGAKYAKAFGS
jgi:hypothetical protein